MPRPPTATKIHVNKGRNKKNIAIATGVISIFMLVMALVLTIFPLAIGVIIALACGIFASLCGVILTLTIPKNIRKALSEEKRKESGYGRMRGREWVQPVEIAMIFNIVTFIISLILLLIALS